MGSCQDNLVDNRQYGKYLDRYLPMKDALKYEDVDEYIIDRHYRRRAIKMLSEKRKSFDLEKWTKHRYGWRFERKSNLTLKEGRPFRLDFRNSLESLFILKKGSDRQILGVGGGGSSGKRFKYSLYTAIYYLLGKKKNITHHLVKYSSRNIYEYVATFGNPLVTVNLGSNYPLDGKLKDEIREDGIDYFGAVMRGGGIDDLT